MALDEFIKTHRKQFCFVGCSIKAVIKDGKVKKDVTWQPWKNTTLETWEKDMAEKGSWCDSWAVKTGKISGITVIDFDDEDSYYRFCEDVPDFNEYFTVKTRKGFHVYCTYDWRFINTTEVMKKNDKEDDLFKGIDIRNDGGVIICPPSSYTCPDGSIATYEFNGGEIREIPEFLSANIDPSKLRTKEPTIDSGYSSEDVDTPVVSDPTNKILIKVVNSLTIDCINSYDIWLRIGMIFYNEKYTVEDWAEISKRGKNPATLEECKEKWKTFNTHKQARKIMGASLWKLLKNKNPTQFWILMEERQDFWNLISLINHNDIANYFYNINPDAYLWNENIGWYSLMPSNIWKHYDKGQPSGIKRHISDTMQNLTKDFKTVELAMYEKKAKKIPIGEKTAHSELLKDHKEKMKVILRAYTMFGSSDFTNGVISYLPSYYEDEKLEEKMDMNRYIFAFDNGLFDLKTCAFREITPQDYVSTTTGYDYPTVKNATARKEINTFLKNLFECNSTTIYLLYVLASFLYGGNRFEEFYGFTGSGGNGKGVIADLLKLVFGNYYISVDNTLFTKPLERKDQPIPALVEARCKRIMMTTEPESDDKLQGGIIKKISGGDIIEARTLHSKHIVKYVPQFKVILQMNDIPKITKIDGGIQRRMRIIKFPFKFVSETKLKDEGGEDMRLGDPDVKEIKCKSVEWRNEFLIILTEIWAVIKDFKELKMPETVKESTGSYMNENNPLKDWLDEYFIKTKNDKDTLTQKELKEFYASDTGKEITDRSFKNLMEFNGFKYKRMTAGANFCFIQRNPEKAMASGPL